MKKISIILITLGLLYACKGPLTGHDYTKDEVIQILKFAGVSAKRIEKYKKGEITPEDIEISKQRLKKAIEYLDKLKKEAEAKKNKRKSK